MVQVFSRGEAKQRMHRDSINALEQHLVVVAFGSLQVAVLFC